MTGGGGAIGSAIGRVLIRLSASQAGANRTTYGFGSEPGRPLPTPSTSSTSTSTSSTTSSTTSSSTTAPPTTSPPATATPQPQPDQGPAPTIPDITTTTLLGDP